MHSPHPYLVCCCLVAVGGVFVGSGLVVGCDALEAAADGTAGEEAKREKRGLHYYWW